LDAITRTSNNTAKMKDLAILTCALCVLGIVAISLDSIAEHYEEAYIAKIEVHTCDGITDTITVTAYDKQEPVRILNRGRAVPELKIVPGIATTGSVCYFNVCSFRVLSISE